MTVAFAVQHFDRTGLQVHPLNPAAGIIIVLIAWQNLVTLEVPAEATVVANITGAVRPDGRAIGATAGFGHYLNRATGLDAA